MIPRCALCMSTLKIFGSPRLLFSKFLMGSIASSFLWMLWIEYAYKIWSSCKDKNYKNFICTHIQPVCSWDNMGYHYPLPQKGGVHAPWPVRSIFSKIFNGLLFGWTVWMFRPNLKFIALPVPGIIGLLGPPEKIGQSLDIRPCIPKIRDSQPPPKTPIVIISGTGEAMDFKFGPSELKPIQNFGERGVLAYPGTAMQGMDKATNFKFCRHIYSIHRKKNQLKISWKVAVSVARDCRKFSASRGHLCDRSAFLYVIIN